MNQQVVWLAKQRYTHTHDMQMTYIAHCATSAHQSVLVLSWPSTLTILSLTQLFFFDPGHSCKQAPFLAPGCKNIMMQALPVLRGRPQESSPGVLDSDSVCTMLPTCVASSGDVEDDHDPHLLLTSLLVG